MGFLLRSCFFLRPSGLNSCLAVGLTIFCPVDQTSAQQCNLVFSAQWIKFLPMSTTWYFPPSGLNSWQYDLIFSAQWIKFVPSSTTYYFPPSAFNSCLAVKSYLSKVLFASSFCVMKRHNFWIFWSPPKRLKLLMKIFPTKIKNHAFIKMFFFW